MLDARMGGAKPSILCWICDSARRAPRSALRSLDPVEARQAAGLRQARWRQGGGAVPVEAGVARAVKEPIAGSQPTRRIEVGTRAAGGVDARTPLAVTGRRAAEFGADRALEGAAASGAARERRTAPPRTGFPGAGRS
jgi:hypothetical protein